MTPRRFRWFVGCACVLFLSACRRTGPVDRSEIASVVGDLAVESRRSDAETRLEQTEPGIAWGPLIASLAPSSGSPPPARVAAVRILVRTAGVRKLPLSSAVEAALGDPAPEVRQEAARALAAAGDPEATAILESARAREADPATAKILASSLEELIAHRRAWYERSLAEGAEPLERALAARTLGSLGDARAVPALRRSFASETESQIRYEIVNALSKLGGSEASDFVLEQLSSKDPFVRSTAAFGETRLRDPRAVPALRQILATDNVGDIRIGAARALALIGGPDSREAVNASCRTPPDARVKQACNDAMAVLRAPAH